MKAKTFIRFISFQSLDVTLEEEFRKQNFEIKTSTPREAVTSTETKTMYQQRPQTQKALELLFNYAAANTASNQA